MKHVINNRVVAMIALAAVAAALVFFGLWRQAEGQRQYRQTQLDQTFATQFSGLYTNLFCTEPGEEVQRKSLGQAAVCEALFSATSYRDNTALREVMRNLYDLARKEDATSLQKIAQEYELVEKLGYLRLHLDDENLVQEVLMMLRKG